MEKMITGIRTASLVFAIGLAGCDGAVSAGDTSSSGSISSCVELAEGTYQFSDGLFIPASGIPEGEMGEASAGAPLQWAGRLQDDLRQDGFDWLSITSRRGLAILEGQVEDETRKIEAIEAASTAIGADPIAADATSIVIDNIEVDGGEAPVGAPLVSLPASPSLAACEAAFAGTLSARTVEFSANNSSISEDSLMVADALAGIALLCDGYQIEIGGHTDARGAESFNERLSQTRADALRDYFIEHDVRSASLSAVGYGESQPIDTSQTTAAYARNRRIEFTLTEPEPDTADWRD
ncbi:OmpA family protein [Henriciella marina]|uniref:OmpA family protein n=1 Tax=Henriciella marina TaxID=453851 RepID=UPI0003822160|nr:OmpA family protein [Henriciella marina]